MPSFPSILTLAIPFFVLSVAMEWLWVHTGRARGRYEWKDALTSMLMGSGNSLVNAVTGMIALWMMMLVWPYRFVTVPITWWSFIAVFVLYDFVYYWKHRFAHRVRWFWMEHVTHHSSRHYNLSTALRQPWFGPFTGLIIIGWPMVLLGFHPAFIFFAGSLNLLYQFWIHTEAIDTCPNWFEAIFNTPSHHRVHHATNPRYLDANYAGVLIIWDKMFGSFVAEDTSEKPDYGTVKPLHSYNPLIVAFHELAALIRDCLSDGVKPLTWWRRASNAPGWSPDGKHQRTQELQAAWRKAQHQDSAH